MKNRVRRRVESKALGILCALALVSSSLRGADLAGRIADRAALELFYQSHRIGAGPGAGQALTPAAVEKLVRDDIKKEAVLARVYGVTITTQMLDAEAERIDATTQAPEMLDEIKTALGGDRTRFARTLARPILVERLLRGQFENDTVLHAAPRRIADAARTAALDARAAGVTAQSTFWRGEKTGVFTEVTWRMAANADSGKATAPGTAKGGVYSVEATAALTPALNPAHEKENPGEFSFNDIDPPLQDVLRVQLQKPGDVSAVVETSNGFLIYLVKEKNAAALSVYLLSIPKRSYEGWLAEQPDNDS